MGIYFSVKEKIFWNQNAEYVLKYLSGKEIATIYFYTQVNTWLFGILTPKNCFVLILTCLKIVNSLT